MAERGTRAPGTGERAGEEPGRSLVPAPPRQAGVERFDDAIVVTRARAWIGLAACLALLLGVVIWASVATISRTVASPGIALMNGPLSRLESPAAGTFIGWTLPQGSPVRDRQVIGWLRTDGHRTALRAPITGRVLLHQVGPGGQVDRGEVLASLTMVSGQFLILSFLPTAQSQLVAKGDQVLISTPEGASGQGRVTTVDPLPLTKPEIGDAIGSRSLAELVAPRGSAVAVTIFPQPPGKRISDAGDIVSVTIIVGQAHPISYVF